MRKVIVSAAIAAALLLLTACGVEPQQDPVTPAAAESAPTEVQRSMLEPQPPEDLPKKPEAAPAPETLLAEPAPTPPVTEPTEPEPTERSAPEVQEQPPVDPIVWRSKSGKKYHSNPDCSGMSNPIELHLSEAVEKGLTPCQNCYGSEP